MKQFGSVPLLARVEVTGQTLETSMCGVQALNSVHLVCIIMLSALIYIYIYMGPAPPQ